MEPYGRTVHGPLFAEVDDDPFQELVSFVGGASRSRTALAKRVRAIATGLMRAGCRPGDRVALMLGNRVEFVETSLACGLAGCIVVPLNPELRGVLLDRALSLVCPRLSVCEADAVARLLDSARGDEKTTYVVDGPGNGSTAALAYTSLSDDAAELREFPDVDTSTPFCIYSSSGTTGASKGVTLPHGAVLSMGETGRTVLGIERHDVVYTPMPLFHANAFAVMFVGALQAGARTVVSPRFSVSRFWDEIANSAATKTSLLGTAGTLLMRTMQDRSRRNTSLKSIAFVPRPPGSAAFARRFDVTVTEFYGSTEASLPLGVPAGEQRDGSCGRVLDGWQCVLADGHDEPVALRETGELLVRSSRPWTTALGYWGDHERTAELWRNQWIHTGDLMRQDEEGWFFYVDRIKDAIRVSGENVPSADVEGVIAQLPELLEVAAFGVPSDLGEQDIMVAAVVQPGMTITAEQIVEHCAGNLPYYAVPRYVELLSSLPRTSTQKIMKAALRERGITSETVDLGRRRRAGVSSTPIRGGGH